MEQRLPRRASWSGQDPSTRGQLGEAVRWGRFPRLPGCAVQHHGALMKGTAAAAVPAVSAVPLAAASGRPSRTISSACPRPTSGALSVGIPVYIGSAAPGSAAVATGTAMVHFSKLGPILDDAKRRTLYLPEAAKPTTPTGEHARLPGRRRSPPARPRRPRLPEALAQVVPTTHGVDERIDWSELEERDGERLRPLGDVRRQGGPRCGPGLHPGLGRHQWRRHLLLADQGR
ncbi:hypothetical protein SAMN02787118_1463 [Streptomyces mirabilis]|uniref:Uncharacterized protein n=1 Tax=Streptomyces mirabilis TaxID=68239 RepID=A0A1I2XHW2_9ACTN|nr:hypothetical protein SAMN02787118_1463 [Streptomyces mirabilis]